MATKPKNRFLFVLSPWLPVKEDPKQEPHGRVLSKFSPKADQRPHQLDSRTTGSELGEHWSKPPDRPA
uniref:Uncharacterized protein n=1 Tax=Anguilla anguilla TaxID=7936 RepID=A0A0E9WD76_ANGAN